MEAFTRNGEHLQRWTTGASTFTACIERGARLMRWELDLPTGKRDVLHWPDDADFANIALVPGGNPILFPFPGRTYADGEKLFWLDPEGVKRPMPQHGLARQGAFDITSATANSVSAIFLPDAAAHESYPYDYDFRVTYTFSELALTCDLSLTNLDTRDIPWCAGHHFYFTLPWHKNLTREDYLLDLPAKKIWRHAADGKLVPFNDLANPTHFADPALRDAIHTRLKTNTATFGPRGGEENITLRVGEEPVPDAWTTIVTWAADPTVPYYCVEPWMGPPNCPTHKNGLRRVAPGKTETFHVSINLA
jgi:galactose mutarotase-like enzyme